MASLIVSGVIVFAVLFVATNGSVALPCLGGFMAAGMSVAISRGWAAGRAQRSVWELARFIPGVLGVAAAVYLLTSAIELWIKAHMAATFLVTLDGSVFSVARILVISFVFGSCLAIGTAATVAAIRWGERSQTT